MQKYTLVHLIDDFPDGYEYAKSNWPLHITLADVFAIQGRPDELLGDLRANLASIQPSKTEVVDEAWFGKHHDTHVRLPKKLTQRRRRHHVRF
ncbi:MAG TPA: hypothetical protein VMT96_00665 [Candidatus Bathyarchaeia archaeon]|nr:hypothetical protein [Candidatus Bathyarchaeia archaeon]